MTDHNRFLAIAHDVVDQAVTLFRAAGDHELTAKGDRDYATETDFRIERELREHLAKLTPDVGFLGEEGGHSGSRDRWWCLDPIDGTVNYVHGNPLCGVSLALVEEDQPTVGVIDLPRLGNRYWATPTGGAFRDGRPIQASSAEQLEDAIISFGDFAVGKNAQSRNEIRLDVLAALVERVLRIRMVGSAATDLAWVADGKLDGAVIIGSHPWDLAAGIAIATAAGATISTVQVGGSRITYAAPATVAEGLRSLLCGLSTEKLA
jgi:myo-inositol-1(or 4)-monophosphatase